MITMQRLGKAAGKHFTRTLLRLRTALGTERRHYCPACEHDVVGFFRYGDNGRWGCPDCGASPRERLVNTLIETGGLVVPDKGAVLHIAPGEASLVRRFSRVAGRYVAADLDPARYTVPDMQAIDLMQFGSGDAYDLFYASHVMEHVPDDARVLSNIFAALKPGGEAWLIVPLWDGASEDGPADMSGAQRERRFGQWDHVRQYGLDFADRIRAAGFDVTLIRASDQMASDVERMALDDVIFRAVKPAGAGS